MTTRNESILWLALVLAAFVLIAVTVGCGGSGGDANDEPVLVGEDAEGRALYDTNGNGRADIACGGRGGDITVVADGGGSASNSGDAGDGGGCVSIEEGDENDGANAGSDQDNSSEETTNEAPAEA